MTNKDLCRIGSRFREARKAKHLTQEQLAELIDRSPAHIRLIEHGERAPSLATFMDIIEALEVTADDILCDVVNYVSKSRLAEYEKAIEALPKKEREKLFKVLDVLLEKN